MYVYHASELGSCTKYLVALRLGFEVPLTYATEEDGSPLELFRRGHEIEAEVIEWLKDTQHYVIQEQQGEYYIAAGEGFDGEKIAIVSHPDAVAVGPNGQRTAVEIKSAADDAYNEFRAKGWERAGGLFPKYRYQVSCYNVATGLPVTFVVRNKERGTTLISYDDTTPPLYTKADLLARVAQIEKLASNYNIPLDCDYPNWLCPLSFLHEEIRDLDINDELDKVVREYEEERLDFKVRKVRNTTKRLELRAKIMKLAGVDPNEKGEKPDYKPAETKKTIRTARSTVSLYWGPTSYQNVDLDMMRADGIDIEKYRRENKYGWRVSVWCKDKPRVQRKDSD